jgi:hypothetical protein
VGDSLVGMHGTAPYEVIQPPRPCLNGTVDALLVGRWHDRSLILVTEADRCAVEWVASRDLTFDWAPWTAAVAANA